MRCVACAQLAMLDSGAVPQMVGLLGEAAPDGQFAAAAALFNTSALSAAARDIMLGAGAMDALIRMLAEESW